MTPSKIKTKKKDPKVFFNKLISLFIFLTDIRHHIISTFRTYNIGAISIYINISLLEFKNGFASGTGHPVIGFRKFMLFNYFYCHNYKFYLNNITIRNLHHLQSDHHHPIQYFQILLLYNEIYHHHTPSQTYPNPKLHQSTLPHQLKFHPEA